MHWGDFLFVGALHSVLLERREVGKLRSWCFLFRRLDFFIVWQFCILDFRLLLILFHFLDHFSLPWVGRRYSLSARNLSLLDWLSKLLWKSHLRASFWMVLEENLPWCLSELCDLNLEGRPLNRILQLFKIDSTLVGYWMEHIEVLNRTLINTEDQVDPEVNVLGGVLAFESFSVLP